MPAEPILLGLDVGTQSVRAALIDAQGNTRAFGTSDLSTTFPQPGWAEQDVESWWVAARAATGAALATARLDAAAIQGIGVAATACTVVACDRNGKPLRPALLWMDQRAAAEAAFIDATDHWALRYVSGRLSPEWMLPKALWLKRNEPAIYDSADRIVECTNWLMHRLTGEWTLSLNHCAVKWNYCRPEGGWPVDLLARVGLDDLIARWPTEIVPLGGGTGRLSAQAAEWLGLKPGIPVAQGGIDAYLGMIGLGAAAPGDVAMILGSSTCHLAQSEAGVFDSGWAGCYPDATVEGLYTLEAGQTATGSILDWYRRNFAGREQAEAEQRGKPVFEILDALAGSVPPGSEGVLIRDDWQGNRSPYKNPGARGAMTGLTLAHGPGHIIRAIYEATACGTRQILDDGMKYGMTVNRIVAGGGGVRSRLWMQIQTNVLQHPVTLTRDPESPALGAAITAAIACGVYPNLSEAAAAMVGVTEVLEPDAATASLYHDVYARYIELYNKLNC